MSGDGILSIGATVDKTGVDVGLSSIQEGFQATLQKITVQVEEGVAKSRAAWNGLGADVKAAAQTVSAESLRLAEATKAQTAAMADLRRASVLSKDAKLDEAGSTSILAAAQQKVAAAAAAVAAAKRAEAVAVARATEEEELSENALVRVFQRASLSVRESLTEMQKKLAETAEAGELGAEGIGAAFSGLGSLLGAGIFVGFAGHFLDETAKVEIELSHLSEKTGIAIQNLAGLQQIVRESGGEWEPISAGLVKMDKALADSAEPSKQLTMALSGIGLEVEELKGKKPEQQLEAIAAAFARSENAGNKAAAAIALFGKGGAALIPILVAQGAALRQNIEATGRMTHVTEDSVAAALKWQETTARLSAEFRSVMIPAITIVEKSIAALLAVIKAIDAVLWSLIDPILALVKSLGVVAKAMWEAFTGQWAKMREDASSFSGDIEKIWADAGSRIAQRWRETGALLTWKPQGVGAKIEADGEAGATDSDTSGGADNSGSRTPGKQRAVAIDSTAPPPLETESPDLTAASAEFIATMQAEADAVEHIRQQEANAEVIIMRAGVQRQLADATAAMQQYEARLTEKERKEQAQAQRITQYWKSAYAQISADFANNMTSWITGQESLGRAWERTLGGMTQTVIRELLQQTVAYLTHAATVEAAQDRQKLSDAAAAARNTWVSVSKIPVVGPFLAPVAAAGAFAAVEAFDMGGVVGARMGLSGYGAHVPILAEAGERVLTPQQNTNFERLISQNQTSSQHIEAHFHDNSNYSAIDGASVSSMARRHAAEFRREGVRQLRLAGQGG